MKTLFIVIGIMLLTLSLSIPAYSTDVSKDHIGLKESAEVICKEKFEDKSVGYKKCFDNQIRSAGIVYYAYMEPIEKMKKGDPKLILQMIILDCNNQSIDKRRVINYETNLQCIQSTIKELSEKLSEAEAEAGVKEQNL